MPPTPTLAAARWLVAFLRSEGMVPLDRLILAAGQAGHLGPQQPDGRWTECWRLRQAAAAVRDLWPPDDNLVVKEVYVGRQSTWRLDSSCVILVVSLPADGDA